MTDMLVPDGADTREAGNRRYGEAQGRMALLPNYYDWIVSRFRRHISGTVVELGVGAGLEIAHYRDLAERVIGVDFDAELLARLKRRYPDDGVEAVAADLRGDWRELAALGPVDTVLALDVMEHFEDDRGFVRRAAGLLAPGGVLCLKVPAQSVLFGPVDEASGHYRRYDPRPLAALMREAGLEAVEQRYMNPIGALGYRLKRGRSTNYSKTFAPRTLRLINAAIPALALLDRGPDLPGLSLTGVYRKPA